MYPCQLYILIHGVLPLQQRVWWDHLLEHEQPTRGHNLSTSQH